MTTEEQAVIEAAKAYYQMQECRGDYNWTESVECASDALISRVIDLIKAEQRSK